MTIDFVVNCKPMEFANWLRLYTEELYEAAAMTMRIGGDLTIGYTPADIELRDKDAGQLRVSIRATVFDVVGEDDTFRLVKKPGPPGDVFVGFTLTPLSGERTEVKAGYVEEAREFFAILIRLIAQRYPESAADIDQRTDDTLPDWRTSINRMMDSNPWSGTIHLPFEDVEAACHEHLEYLSAKRYAADWDVQVTRYVEREAIATRYDVQSARRMVGHVRVRRIGRLQTRVEVKPFLYGDDNDLDRMRGIMALFVMRWLAEGQYVAAAEISPEPNADDDKSAGELRTALLGMGYPAERVERALEEHRREQQMGQGTRLEMEIELREQNLDGAYIESATTIHAGAITGEPDGVVMDRRLSGISAQLEELREILERQTAPIQQQVVVELPKLSRKPPGRHPDPENDAAYQIILNGGGTQEAADNAYAYWCEAKNIRKPTQGDRNNFNQAMKRAAERVERGQLSTE